MDGGWLAEEKANEVTSKETVEVRAGGAGTPSSDLTGAWSNG